MKRNLKRPETAGINDILSRDGGNFALFLDFDGTLVDIAPTPGAAVAPPGLPELLARLEALLGGALAVVSGREIADIDHRLRPFCGRAAGVHGAEIRFDPKGAVTKQGALDPSVLAGVRRVAAPDPRLLIEDKSESVAIHYRGAADAMPGLERALEEVAAAAPDGLLLLRGRMVFEILRAGVSKGEAVSRFMAAAPFAGRRPVMVGDDRTDVAAIEACIAHGGYGFRVAGGLFSKGEAEFSDPAAVRAWLADLAAGLSS
ncbi:trehalose-phosphatase [Rhodoblastus acidophilus]|uniref:Trehalose 6-phosphate phosphatase n=1 Tax=Candidatus Rhodoblastus alkanivorans TaxID=2954117 RepID=A0ABS9Z7T0_9HYPH|nr:trehalose-phosphatase [Candidatus Rhodoblastus alkanivorans]MCI4678980.1 trehalose-phosphatase [Candidatus Rhodoblastus alkanivorans]MCI4683758.1 trehalose-phosphatase [Candidatus Rhodoblastus alkanivorans]MDI4641076.1 trehalose-phosphatase [Rhodoblastus acidophilus]